MALPPKRLPAELGAIESYIDECIRESSVSDEQVYVNLGFGLVKMAIEIKEILGQKYIKAGWGEFKVLVEGSPLGKTVTVILTSN